MAAGEGLHLWVGLSPHGYGHAAMTAPVVAELRRRRPGLRVTLQTRVARDFLASRYDAFELVDDIPDFGLRMTSSTGIDLDASAAAYRALHADWPAVVGREAGRLAAARPDLVLANVPYVTVAAAAQAGIPVVAMSSLEWSGIYSAYLGDRPEAAAITRQMADAYARADLFLRCTPAMDMRLPNLCDIGPVARRGADRRHDLHMRLGLAAGTSVGLIAFGGIDHDLDLGRWPCLPGWVWLTAQQGPARQDILDFRASGLAFADLLASVDVVVGKPGYGTFTEAGMCGVPVLYIPRPDWPESPNLDQWLARHTRCRAMAWEDFFSPDLGKILDSLLSQTPPPLAQASGVGEAADILERVLDGGWHACGRS